ncbi:hypothetical protein [Yersinia intermedia]|uniref:hypothetical protein n=1 Tax=Yersinia intermedia TaxID=631 RepID=UPI000B1CEA50|nr:hypothetical protein [Yersinia intermedia]
MQIFAVILQWGAMVGRILAGRKIKNEYRTAPPLRGNTARYSTILRISDEGSSSITLHHQ